MKLFCVTIFLSLWVSPMVTTPCQTVVRIKQQAMEYACQTQRTPLQKSFSIIPIPDLTQKTEGGGRRGIFGNGGLLDAGQALLGNVWNLVGIKILDVKLPEINVKLVPHVGAQMSIDTRIHIGANLVIGAIELEVGAGVVADIRISKTSKGFPILDITACKSICGDIEITVGGLRLLRPIMGAIQGHIHAILSEQLCLSVSNVLLRLNANLGLMTEINLIGDDLSLQYTLQNPPVVTGDYVDMDMDAEYRVHEQVFEYPTGAQEFTLPPGAGSQDAMVNMGFSKDFFNSFFTSWHSSGGFNFEILSTYASLASQLRTSVLGSYIPEINQKYSQSLPVNVNIVLSRAPILTFHASQLILEISPSVEILVVLPNSQLQHLLTVDVGVSLVAALDAQGGKLKTSVSLNGELNLAFASVSFGQCKCNPSSLAGYMRTLFEEAYILQLNGALSVGLSLPMLPNVHFIHQVIEVQETYVVMSCDLESSQQQHEWK